MRIVNAYGSVLQMHGATKYLMAFANELKRQGHDSSILCAEFRIPKPYWLTAPVDAAHSNGTGADRSRLAKALGRFAKVPSVARRLPVDADVVVLHSEHALPLLPFVRRRCPSAVVVYYCYQPPREVYDLWSVVKKDFGPLTRAGLRVAIPFYKLIDKTLARSADLVLVFSSEYRGYAREIYGDLDYALVPAGIDFRLFENNDEAAVSKREDFRRGHQHHLLMSAALTRKKNIDLFVRLLAALVERGFDVAGTVVGEGALQDVLLAQAEELGVSKRLALTGYVTQEDLPHYYHSADVLLYLEPNGAWTMSILEAGAAKKPVIVAPGGSMPTLVQDGETGFILKDETDLEALVANTARLLRDADLRSKMGENNYRHSSQFSLENSAAAFFEAVARFRRSDR